VEPEAWCGVYVFARLSRIPQVALNDLLKARTRHLEEEVRREKTLHLKFFFPGGKMPRAR
jgi:hypothetical protein